MTSKELEQYLRDNNMSLASVKTEPLKDDNRYITSVTLKDSNGREVTGRYQLQDTIGDEAANKQLTQIALYGGRLPMELSKTQLKQLQSTKPLLESHNGGLRVYMIVAGQYYQALIEDGKVVLSDVPTKFPIDPCVVI